MDSAEIIEMFKYIIIMTLAITVIYAIIFSIIALMITKTYKTTEELYAAIENSKRRREERIAAFFGTQSTYNNPSNITDDAFLLFIGEQKLAYRHPESIKSDGEEW